MNSTEDFAAEMAIIRKEYLLLLATSMQQIRETYARLKTAVWDINIALELCEMVHKISGSGGTYGFVELSNSAREMEHLLSSIIAHKSSTAEQRALLQMHFTALTQAAKTAMASH
jgi:chemotaxis protein histidine kinase CheA